MTYGLRGPEHTFYKMIEERRLKGDENSQWATAAQGGYFDADAYFAEGGSVSSYTPASPPQAATTVDRSFPVMAYTDGQGPVGYVAAAPALTPYENVGRDAPIAMPAAPSAAAAAPQIEPVGPLSTFMNRNAQPTPSQISQNPNLGYSLGSGPLSKFRR